MSNFVEEHLNAQKIAALTNCWRIEKEKEDAHKQTRISIEQQILAISKINQEISGTKVLPNNIRISCKINRKWDQQFLNDNMHILNRVDQSINPFSLKYVENKKKMDALQLLHKDIYDLFSEGLVEEPAKPAFKLHKENKE